MKRLLLTAAMVLSVSTLFAKGSDTILEHDPYGVYVAIVSVTVVLFALIVLAILIWLFGKLMVKSANRKAARSRHAAAKASGRISVDNGEVIAAIALAVKLHKAEQHDHESDVITINRVARVYSPWSSKIHGLTPTPERK